MITLFLIAWPLITGLLLFLSGEESARKLALVSSLVQLVATAFLFFSFQSTAETQFLVDWPWVQSLGIHFKVGIDGISIIMVLLTNLLLPFIILSSGLNRYDKSNALYALMLIMQSALIGVFTSLDGFLYYIFWELALIPVYFILLLWGSNRKVTVKFFLYTLAGSLFMLAGLIYLYTQTESKSFDIDAFYALNLPAETQKWVFWLIFIAFAIKIPVFPFHSWQPATYTESPTPGTMLLSGIMLKMGLYSMIRWILPVLPEAADHWDNAVIGLCVIGIVYGAWIAINQKDIKTLFAFSSMSHVGLIAAGIMAANVHGLQGSLIQMLSHGINVVGLFFIADIIYKRTGTREIEHLGGIRSKAPVFATLFMIILLGSVALPLTNGFVGEFLLLSGVYQFNAWYAAAAGTTIILGAVYMLKMYQHTMLGDVQTATADFADVNLQEKLVLVPIVILVIAIGVYPKPLLDISAPAVNHLLEQMNSYTTYLR